MADDKDKYLFNRQTAYDLLKQEGYTDIGESAEDLFKNRGNSELAYQLLRKAGYTDLGKDYGEFAAMLYGPDTSGVAKHEQEDATHDLNFNDEPNLAPLNERARKSAEKEQRKAEKEAERAARDAQKATERAALEANKARREMTPQERTRAFNQETRMREAKREARIAKEGPEALANLKAAQKAEDEAFRARVKQEKAERERTDADVQRFGTGNADYTADEAASAGREFAEIAPEIAGFDKRMADFNAKYAPLEKQIADYNAGKVQLSPEEYRQMQSQYEQYKADSQSLSDLAKRYDEVLNTAPGREYKAVSERMGELANGPKSAERAWEYAQEFAKLQRNPVYRASLGDGAPSEEEIQSNLLQGQIAYLDERMKTAKGSEKKELKKAFSDAKEALYANPYYRKQAEAKIAENQAENERIGLLRSERAAQVRENIIERNFTSKGKTPTAYDQSFFWQYEKGDPELQRLDAAAHMHDDAIREYQKPTKYDDSRGLRNVGKGVVGWASDTDTWSFGIEGFVEDIAVVRPVLEKVQSIVGNLNEDEVITEGNIKALEEQLTPGELAVLDAYFEKVGAVSAKGADTSIGYQIGQGIGDMVTLGLEMVATGGAGGVARTATEKGLKKGLVKLLGKRAYRKAAQSGAGKVALWAASKIPADMVETAVRIPFMPSTYKALGEGSVQLDSDYKVRPLSEYAPEKMWDQYVEQLTEVSNGFAFPLIGKVVKTPGMQKMIKGVLGEDGTRALRTFMERGDIKLLDDAMLGSFGGEWEEELLGAVIHSVTDDPAALRDFFSAEQQLVLLGTLAPLPISRGLAGGVPMAYTTAKADIAWNRAQSELERAGLDEGRIARLKEVLDNAPVPEAAREVMNAWNDATEGLMEVEDADRTVRGTLEQPGITYGNNARLYDRLAHYFWAAQQKRALGLMDEIEQDRKIEAKRSELEQRFGGKFFHSYTSRNGGDMEVVEYATMKGLDGAPINILLTSESANNNGEYSYVSESGLKGFVGVDEITFGSMVPLDEYLASLVMEDAQNAQVQGMVNVAVQGNRSLRDIVEALPEITYNGQKGTITRATEDGAVFVPDDDEADNIPLTWAELAEANGIDVPDVPTEAERADALAADVAARYQAQQDIADNFKAALDASGGLAEAYVDTDEGRAYVIDIISDTIDPDAGTAQFTVRMPDGRMEVTMATAVGPVMSQLRGEAAPASEPEDEDVAILEAMDAVTLAIDAQEGPKDFRGNPIPMKDGEVDEDAFRDADPEAWAAWNDALPEEDERKATLGTKKRLEGISKAAKAAGDKAEKDLAKLYDKGAPDKEIREKEAEIRDQRARQKRYEDAVANINKRELDKAEAEREAARQAAEAERLRREKEREELEKQKGEKGVPDVSDDTPEAAQKRGYIMANGNRIDRPTPDAVAAEGNETRVSFTKSVVAEGKYGLVDATRIEPSHVNDQENPVRFFTKMWQPKKTEGAFRSLFSHIANEMKGVVVDDDSPLVKYVEPADRIESYRRNNVITEDEENQIRNGKNDNGPGPESGPGEDGAGEGPGRGEVREGSLEGVPGGQPAGEGAGPVVSGAPANPALEAPAGFGANNKLFTKDARDKAREIMLRKLKGQLNAGIDPEMLTAMIQYCGYYIEAGVRTFVEFAKTAIADLGDAIRPYLKSMYTAVRHYPGMEEYAKEMTPYDEVEKIDVDTIGKEEEPVEEPAEEPAEEAPKIPLDKDGNPIYDAPGVSVEDALADMYTTEGLDEADVDEYIINRAAEAEKGRAVKQGKMSLKEWGQKKKEANRVAEFWGELAKFANENKAAREKEEKAEAERQELIKKYGVDTSKFDLTPQTAEEAVAEYLGRSEKLINLDDAVRETLGRRKDNRIPTELFRHLGAHGILTKNGGRSIQDVASDIVREFYGDLEHDAQQDEARNTIIDFLLGKTKKEMREFIFNNRLETAEKELTLLNDENEVLRSAGVGSPAGNQDGAGTADGGGLRAEPGSHATDGGTGTDGGRVLPGLARREQGAGGNAEKLEVAADERSGADGYSDGQSQQEVFDRHPGEPARGAGRPDSGSDESGELGAEGADGGKRSRVADGLSGAVRPGTVRRGVPSHRVGLKGLLSYVRHSKGKSLDTVSPSAIAEANDKTLSEIEKQYGSVDGFVMDELGYDSKEALYAALSAEQIDSVAMAIHQMKQGRAMIIGDQTGVGKGRQMAALIRWANRHGKKPIFFTKDDTLFSDLYRDMKDTGSQSLRPLIINAKAKMIDGDSVAYSAPSETELDKIVQDGQVPDGYDYVVLTYSQLSSGDAISRAEKKSKTEGRERSMARADFIRKIARDNYLFCDESHTAAGRGQTGAFMRSIIPSTIGVTFASATFAKRPDSMPLYAIKSAMVEAKVGALELIQMVQRGGVTLQEILSRNLAEAGQMVRRQRLMNDVKTEWKTVTNPELAEKAKEGYDGVIGLYKDIVDFRRNHGGAFSAPNTYAFVRQLLLSLKVDAIVEEAVSELKAGRKPIIALENTRESSISDFQFGDELPVATFGLTLAKMLGGADGLDEEGQRNYQELLDRIRKVTKDIPASPIDTITEKLEALGYKVGEITGRTKKIVTRDGKPVVEKQVIEPVESARSFNNGETNALIINRSGATGISLHASETFDDQKQRTMIIAQPLGDINEYQQMLGRIDRTGQVARGNYINLSLPIPAEQRFNMMLANKLRSLSANTTAESGAGNIEAPDLLNRYGAKVMCEYLQDNPEVFDALGIQLGYKAHPVRSIEDLDRYTPVEEDAEKITAALALIPIEQQEAFYEDVTRRYEDLIKSLDEAGQNELKSTTLPLRARTLSKKVGTRGKDPDGSNPFAKDSYIERVEVDVLTKPMTVSEIEEAREALGGKEAIKKLLVRLEAQRNARLEAEERRYGEFKAKNEGQDLSDAEARHAANVARINRIHDVIAENLKRFSPDRTYLIHEEFGMDAEDNYGRNGKIGSIPGVLIGFKAPKDGESLTPSKMNAVFATLDGRRKVEVKLSDGFILDDIWGNTEANPEEASRTTLDNWDSSIPKETREERYILTGNVLQAWADVSNDGVLPGRLAYFTDQDGNIRYGILMNKSWMPERSGSAGSPISDFLQAILDGKVVRSIDGKVQVQKATDGYFKGKILLIVPKAVKDGGAIAKDKAVIRMVNGQNFSTHNYNYKLAAVTTKKLPELLQYLSEKYNVRVGDDVSEQDAPEQEGRPQTEERKYVPTIPEVDQGEYQSRLETVRARMAEAANEHGKDSEEYRSLKNEEKEVISDYIDAMDPDHIKVDVISVDDAESFYRSLGYDEESTADFVEFIRNNPVAAEYIPKTGSIVFFTENQFDMEVTRRAYSHERQHHLTVRDGLHKLLAQNVGNDADLLEAELAKLTDAATAASYREFYKDEAAEGLANEIISYAMERVYTDPGFANVLDNLQLAEEIGKFLNVVIDGQFKASVRPAIQGRNYGRIADAGGNQGSEQAPAGEPGEVQGSEGTPGGAESNPSPSIDTADPADIHSIFGLPKAVEHINDLSILLGVPFKMDDSINGKGKFSPSTGTVSINFSAHKDIADLERTYLHEAVAHFGLRALYGKEWGKVRKNLYEKASPEIKAKVDAIAKNDGLSVEVAMEEYIAELAEDGRFTEEEETFWKKVVDAVLSFFAELGIGEKLLTDSDFRAMLYASYRNLQNAGAIEKAAQVVTYQNLRSMADAERETDGNTDGDNPGGGLPSPGLARETETETETDSAPGDPANVPEEYRGDMADLLTDEEEEDLFRRNRSYIVAETASDVYSRRTASPWQNIRAQLVDEYQPVLNLIRAILNSKGDLKSKDVSGLKDDERVVERLVEKSSREMYEIERYGTEFMRPMQDAIGHFIKSVNKSAGKDGRIQMKDLVRYACLKHSLERNGVFARRDAKIAAKKVYEDAYAKRKKDLDERERTEKTRLQVKLDEGIISDVTFHNETVRLEAELQQLRDKAKSDLDANIANVDNETAREYKRILGETRQVDYSALMSWFENPSTLKRSDYPSREKFNEAKAAEKRSYVDGVTDLASAEAMALAYVEDMERRAGTEATGELWRSINAATKETLRMQNEHGILSAKQYGDLSGMFQYYLPMRGFDDPTAETTYVYYNSPRGDGFAPTVVTAKGRKGTMFKDPFGMIGFMHSSAVSQGLKNEAKLALLTLVRHYPTDLVTISRTWYQKTGEVDETGKPIYMPVFPVIPDGTSTKDREGIVSKFEKDMEDLRSKGEAYNSLSGIVRNGGIVAFEKDTHKQEHIIRVLEGGKEYDIIINGNPAAAQAINGLPARSKAVQYTAAAFDSVRNFMSRAATTWNPGFWVVNFFRDTIQGVSNAFIRDGFGYLAKYGLNWARIVTQIAFHSAGAEKMMARIDPKIAAYYKEFNENGGAMRWARIEDDASYTRKINRYIRLRQYEKANSMNLARFLGRILSSIGESIETLTRFTTFVTSREAGKPLHESIADAKEITTNFSRKGRRSYSYDDIRTWQYENGRDLTAPERVAFTVISWLAGTLRHFIMFFNPSVQGVEQTRSNFANHPYRTSLVAATYMLAGFCMMFLRGAGDGDGDDEKSEKDLYGHAPDYHRRKFFLIPTGEGHYVRIPLPQEYRAFYELGDIAASAFLQDRPFEMLTHDAFAAIMDLGPVGVFADEAGPLHSVLPSWLVPPAEIKMNKNFMGGRVYDDRRNERFDPEWTKALPKTGEGFVKLSEELNRISGGGENNDIVQGAIDVNPDIIEHLINGYLGGMVRETELVIRYARAKKRGDSVKGQEIPLLGRILYDVGDRDAHYTDLYYHFRDIAQKAENLDKQFRDRRNSGGKQIDDFYSSKDYQYMLAFKESDAEERDLKAERKDAERRNDRDGEKEAELKIQRLHERTGKRCMEIYLAPEHR